MAYHRSLPACVCVCVCEIASFGVYICEKESDFIDDGVCYKLQGVSVSTAYLYRYNLKYSQLKLSFNFSSSHQRGRHTRHTQTVFDEFSC